MSQSTNDVYPTALRLALHMKLETLLSELTALQGHFAEKGAEFADVIKMGRTQLQDAVPMTLGQEFHAFAYIFPEFNIIFSNPACKYNNVNPTHSSGIGPDIFFDPIVENVQRQLGSGVISLGSRIFNEVALIV